MNGDMYSSLLSELIKKVQGLIGKDDGEKELMKPAIKQNDDQNLLDHRGAGLGTVDDSSEEADEHGLSDDELKEYISPAKKKPKHKASAVFGMSMKGPSKPQPAAKKPFGPGKKFPKLG